MYSPFLSFNFDLILCSASSFQPWNGEASAFPPRAETPSKHSTLLTESVLYPTSSRGISDDLARLADELRIYDNNKVEENKELGEGFAKLAR